VQIDLPPSAVGQCLDEVGMAFLFARRLHPAMRHVAGIRAELGVPTVFNLLGPLCNPAGVRRQVIGVSSSRALSLVARALVPLGCEHALVVHGRDGVDEISLAAPTDALEVRNGHTEEIVLLPETFDLAPVPADAIGVSTLEESVSAIRTVLNGVAGPHADVVAANAGAALYVAGLAPSLADGARRARESIASGAAREILARLVGFTQRQGSGDARR
jgi:anthranilate phosphoribosyltransferase